MRTRNILRIGALSLLLPAALWAQQNPYEGVSQPPADDTYITTNRPPAKPSANHPVADEQTQVTDVATPAAAPQPQARPSATDPDADIVQPSAPAAAAQPEPIRVRPNAAQYASKDPDGDIVHPRQPRAGELPEGATIRVRLLQRLSTATTEKGEDFRTLVSIDVLQNGRVLIPAGAEIDGHIVEASSGTFAGRGTMRLRPEYVILPNGTRYRMHAELSSTPGNSTRVNNEGTLLPGPRTGRDAIEYGGAVGTGATTGAIMGGPAGAVAGGLIGAGAVTAHLLISHPQAVLETGTALVFTLTEPLSLDPAPVGGE